MSRASLSPVWPPPSSRNVFPAAPTESTSIMLLNRCRQSGERVLLWNADCTQPETAAITSA